MNKRALIGILVGFPVLLLACLCAPTGFFPNQATETPSQVPPTEVPSPTVTVPTLAPTLVPTITLTLTVTPPANVVIAPACITGLTAALHKSETSFSGGDALETDFDLVKYNVSGDEIVDPVFIKPIRPDLKPFQEDTAAHRRLWRFFANIIPSDQRSAITGFSVFTDGPSNSLGAVRQGDTVHDWILEMDIQDGQNFPDLSSTLIHELGHVLTLNDTQVVPDLQVFENPNDEAIYERAANQCKTFFMFEGCSMPDSYINQFFERFWTDIHSEWEKAVDNTDEAIVEANLEKFYRKYDDQFVSYYAVTSPEEDIAESFMYFIFTPKKAAINQSAEKVAFFYEFPQLVALREQILYRLCTYVVKP